MQKKMILSILTLVIIVIALIATANFDSNSIAQNNNTEKISPSTVNKDTDNDGISDSAERILGTDPLNSDTDGDGINDKNDTNPSLVASKIIKSTGISDFIIKEILVENNYDPILKKDASDHLEIIVVNNGQFKIDNFVVYYTISNSTLNQNESYLLPLEGFVLKGGEEKSIHIDTSGENNHFRANPNSMYYLSTNEMDVKAVVNAMDHQAQTASIKKDAGGAELAD